MITAEMRHPQPHQLTWLVFFTLGTLKGSAQGDPPKYQNVTAAIESDLPCRALLTKHILTQLYSGVIKEEAPSDMKMYLEKL